MERLSSTFSETYIPFVPNMYGLAQAVLMWKAKVFAVAMVDAAAVVTN